MAYDIVITTYNDIFIILGFLFQHLALGNLHLSTICLCSLFDIRFNRFKCYTIPDIYKLSFPT